jgi:hypothetical protein
MKSLVDIATFKENLELERLLALIQIPPEKPPVVLRRLPRLKNQTTILCSTEARVVAWIQNFPEQDWGKGQGEGRGRLRQDQARLLRAGGISWNLAEMEENMIEDCEKAFRDVMQQGQRPIE